MQKFGYQLLIGSSLLLLQGGLIACASQEKPETWITVFVHGIMSIKPHLSLSNFILFMTDSIDETVYSSTVDLMRKDPIFHQNQAMQGAGLQKIDPNNVCPGYASGAMAMVFEKMSKFVNPDKNLDNHYYTFGWAGLMSQKNRYTEALELYKQLTKEIALCKQRDIDPKIRIIGYSHGGNVLLNLALVRQRNPDLAPLTIHELVLLGMPVQAETDYLISDPIFEKIYHIYSRGDRIQKLDFFSFNRFFSRRLFKARKGFTLPDKLIQIQLKCTRNSRCSDLERADLYNFNSISIMSGKSQYLRDASPGHTELWFFGWTPANYRAHFPLYPLPAASLVPMIVREAHNFEEKNWFEKPTLIDIRPQQEVVLIRNQKSKKTLTIAEFLPQSELIKLGEIALQYKPEQYTNELYGGGIKKAYNQAVALHKEIKTTKKCAGNKKRRPKH